MQTLSALLVATIASCASALQTFEPNANFTMATDFSADMDGLMRYTQPLAENFADVSIKLKGHVPNYLKGDLINACPSLFKVGKYELTYYMDGFFRYNRYRIDGKKATLSFTSKLVDDNRFYTRSMKAGEPQDMLFSYPKPKRMADRMPGITMNWCGSAKQCDNIGIMPWQLPDGTMVFTTDSPDFIKFNPDDLSTQGWHEWDDDFKTTTLGTTHIVSDISTGDTIGLVTEMYNKAMMKQQQVFYRIKKDAPNKRIRIGSMPNEDGELWYYHSFGHTADYLMFPQISVTMSTVGLMAGNPMEQNFKINPKKNAKFYVMKIADGTYTEFDAGHFAFMMHTGNNYMTGNIYTTYQTTYVTAEDPFDFQSFSFLHNPNRTNVSPAMSFRRYDINMDTKEVLHTDIVAPKTDCIDFPIVNPTFQGKKNCFHWIAELLFSQGTTAILKIDHCHGEKVTRWEEKGTWVSEPYFVDDPTSKAEDAGTVMVSIFDEKINKNRLIMISGQTMKTVSDTTLPTFIPQTLHQGWYPRK